MSSFDKIQNIINQMNLESEKFKKEITNVSHNSIQLKSVVKKEVSHDITTNFNKLNGLYDELLLYPTILNILEFKIDKIFIVPYFTDYAVSMYIWINKTTNVYNVTIMNNKDGTETEHDDSYVFGNTGDVVIFVLGGYKNVLPDTTDNKNDSDGWSPPTYDLDDMYESKNTHDYELIEDFCEDYFAA